MKSKMSLIVIFAVIGSMCFYSQLGFAQAGGQNPGSGHMNPPGAKGGPGAGPKVTQHPNPPGAKGGPGAGPSFNRPGNQPDAQAGPGAKQHYVNPPGAAGGPGMGRNFKQHADQNQDGTVNGVERKLAREKWQENHQQGLQEKEHRFNPPGEAGGPGMGEGFKERMDRNNDGVVDDFERQAALKKWKEAHPGESGMSDELKQKMDQNGDGVVDPLEKQAALSK